LLRIIHAQFQEKLYYPFVGDRDPKIPKNKLVRFYEVITIYWLTQINEIVILGLTSLIIGCRYFGPTDLTYRSLLGKDLIAVVIVFILNRVWVRASLNKVRRATEEEILAILDTPELQIDLEQRLEQLCKYYSIPYGKAG
jgi:hypothetical protein